MQSQVTPIERPAPSSITELTEAVAYAQARTTVFPSVESWRWFYRRHRAELFELGAVLEVAGRLMVVPSRFDEAIFRLASSPRRIVGRAA